MNKSYYRFLSLILIIAVIGLIYPHQAEAKRAVNVIKEVVKVIAPILVVTAIIVGGIFTGGALFAAAPAFFLSLGLGATFILGAVIVAASFLISDCIFNNNSNNPIDPNVICTERSGGVSIVDLKVNVMVNGSNGPVALIAPADFQVQWAIQGADESTTCSATGNWSGNITNASGAAEIQDAQTGNYNYGINCSKTGAESSDSVAVNVIGPEVNLYGPTEVLIPNPLYINWTASNVSSCSAASNPNIWNGSKLFSGPETIYSETSTNKRGTYDFTLTCSDDSGNSASDSHTTTVIQVPRCSFSADPTSIILPQSSTLSWFCDYADTCSIDQGIGSVNNVSGSKEVRPAQSTTYTLTCNGLDGLRAFVSTVNVGFTPKLREVAPW